MIMQLIKKSKPAYPLRDRINRRHLHLSDLLQVQLIKTQTLAIDTIYMDTKVAPKFKQKRD